MNENELATLVANLRLIGTDEQSVEVKSGVGKSVRESLSALSNGDGGLLLVGLTEDLAFQPIEGFDARKAQDQLEQRCQQLTPPVRPTIDLIPFEGEVILAAKIEALPSRDKPCYVTDQGKYGGSYVRTGDGDLRLTNYEIDRLVEEHAQPKWDEEAVVEAEVDDLGDAQLSSFLALQEKRRPKTFAEGRDLALKRLRITKGSYPTLAALLVMGEYPQEFYPRLTATFALFPGTDKAEVATGHRLLDSQTITGSIPEIVQAGVAAVERNMRTGALIGDVFRTDVPDYPPVAVREALVNALMHRDYSPASLGAPVQINMFVDRLEITSPGGLYGGVSVRTLGAPGVSSTRNQRITTFLEDIPLPGGGAVAENRGTGIPTIQRSLADALMPPPTYLNRIDSFTITFHRRRVASTESYGTARDEVLAHLESCVSASTTETVHATGLSRSAVQKALNELIAEGRVERTEPTRSPRQRYRLVCRWS